VRRMQDSVAASASIEANLPRLEAISLSIPGSWLRVQTTDLHVLQWLHFNKNRPSEAVCSTHLVCSQLSIFEPNSGEINRRSP
jgi:hypothetical protein